MDWLAEYGMFAAKTATIVLGIVLVVVVIVSAVMRGRDGAGEDQEELAIDKLNDKYDDMKFALEQAMADKKTRKQLDKAHKKELKQQEKQQSRPRLFCLEFDGDIRASAVEQLRKEITAILAVAGEQDEVFVKLESPGGMVHGYGLAASQLARVRDRNIALTVAVDKVAASGGYMMACVADKIIAAPFAILGSIGVVASMPNFNRLLKKHDIDYEMHTAGEFKRTLTVFGENTEKAREKFRADMEDTHVLFKEFVSHYRSAVTIDEVATGEYWFGQRALEKKLVDEIKTSDDYLMEKIDQMDIYKIKLKARKNLAQRMGMAAQQTIEKAVDGILTKSRENELL